METIPFLTKEDVAVLDSLLMEYLQKSEATLAVMIDKGGTVIAQQGGIGSVDISVIAALAAGSFSATRELARRIGETEFTALYHQGKEHYIFMSALDDHAIIVTVFGDRTTLGLVRFYTVNVAAQLAPLLEHLRRRGMKGSPSLLSDPNAPIFVETARTKGEGRSTSVAGGRA